MFRTRVRKILRDVMARKGRTLLVASAIFIGVAGTIALFSMGDILVSQLNEDIKQDELSMINTFVTVNAGTELDNEAYLESLRQIEEITLVRGGNQSFAYFVKEGDYNKYQEKIGAGDTEAELDFNEINLWAYSEPLDQLTIEPMTLLEGEWPAPDSTDVVLETRTAEKFGVKAGDTLYFRVLSPSSDPAKQGEVGTIETRRVAGIVFHPYAQVPDETIYSNLVDANYLTATTGYNVFTARFETYADAEESVDDFPNTITEQTPYIPVFTQSVDPAENELITGVQTLSSTMSVLALVALIVSGFLVINVISSIVIEQKRQIGVMKSLGATTGDNFFMYTGIAFAYGVLGVIPGLVVGIWGGSTIANLLAPEVNTIVEGFNTSPSSIVIGVIVGLLVPVLASILPVLFGTRVKILDAMTDLGIDVNYGSGPIAKLIKILPLPVTIKQGLSNVSIKKSRVFFTVITLSIAVGAYMGIFGVFNSLTSGLGSFFDTFNVEIFVFPNEGRDPDEVTSVLKANFQNPEKPDDNFIKSIEPGFQLQVEIEGYEPPLSAGGPPGLFAYGYDTASETPAFKVNILEGEALNAENGESGTVITSNLSDGLGKGVGDTFTLVAGGNKTDLTIVGIADFPIDQLWMDWEKLAVTAEYVVGAPIPNQYQATVNANGTDVVVLGIDDQFVSNIPLDEGTVFTEDAPGVIISSELAESGGYAVGDTLTLTAGENSQDLPITGIFTLPAAMTAQMGGEVPSVAMFWRALAALEGRSLEGEPLPQGYFITTTFDEPTGEELDEKIDEINEVMLANGIPSGTFNFIGLIEDFEQGILVFQIILSAASFLIALVGALGLLTTLSMSVFERQKEIGVMRSIGAGSSTVAAQFLTEGLLVGFISWLVGIPLAYGITLLLLDVTNLNETFNPSLPAAALITGFIGIMAIATVASLWPSISASRKTVSDILRYQ